MSLKSILDNKNIGFLLHGHSLKNLDENIYKFKDFDITWITLNNYKIVKPILDKIDHKLSVLLASSRDWCNQDSTNRFEGEIVRELPDLGNTMHAFLLMLVHWRVFPRGIYLFGADGYSSSDIAYFNGESDSSRVHTHRVDCNNFNEKFPIDYPLPIYNVNLDSKYHIIPKIGINRCIFQLSCQH